MRHALLGALLAACSDYNRGSPPDAAVGVDAAPVVDAAPANDSASVDVGRFSFDCAGFCERTRAACGNPAHQACVTQCMRKTASIPRACVSTAEALGACARTAMVRCATGATIPFVGCDPPYDMLVRCITM